ncbi:MAG TPA: cell wall-active antibiotics response protein [Firmicutes bacterium]|nr:cell wall-active antibiotics response protein [Bacillota bacterium]
MRRIRGSLILILFGVAYLLYNLNIIGFSPWSLLWPALLIWLATSQLLQTSKDDPENSWEIALWLALLALGIYLLLPKLGIVVPKIPWAIVWPLVLIAIGMLKLFSGKPDFIRFGYTSSDGTEFRKGYRASLIGEINRGPGSWALDDVKLHQSIGSVNLDLTQAIIPDREVELDVSGLIGDVNIYLPPGLAFHADCQISLGEITVLEYNESGSHRRIEMQSPNYETATQKVKIRVRWRIGDVNVRQIR